MPIDYSKWKKIEISDDEDDTHPNIDTPSLFRWRHQARVEREAEAKREKEEFEKKKRETEQKRDEIKRKLCEAEQNGAANLEELKNIEEKLKKQEEEFKQKEEELHKKEKLTPWNVDTICHDKFAKTVINKDPQKLNDDNLSEEERAQRYKLFIEKNKSKVKHFGMLRHYDDSKKYLTENPELVCDDTANYLVVWCIDLEIEEKHDLMEHVAHQCIVMQFILELSKTLKYDPRACVGPFFSKMQLANTEYKTGFNEELSAFKQRIRNRAKEKIDAAMKEVEEEERQKRLGPGGLDPIEVFETLPEKLKECFESQNIELLQQALLTMKREEAEYHMDRCVKSGLWVPDTKTKEAALQSQAAEENSAQEEKPETSEQEYAEVAAEKPAQSNESTN